MRPPSEPVDDQLDTAETLSSVTVNATVADAPAARRRSSPTKPPPPGLRQQPTQQLPVTKGAGSTAGPSDESSLKSNTISTPIEALHLEEVERTRIFLRICFLIVFAVAASMQVLGGDPVAKALVYLGLAFGSITMTWLYFDLRDPSHYTIGKVTAVGYSLIIAAYGGVYYFGIFSPAPAALIIGIYFFSLGGSLRATFAIYITCALALATVAVAIAMGWIVDRGLVTADRLEPYQMLITQGVVQVLFLCTFLIARASREATLDAIERLQSAMRSVGAREALLLEARQDLDRALEVGGPGRFTGQLLGSYTLGNLLGRGGMGEVYEAAHVKNGAPAAIKLLPPHSLSSAAQVTRFERETQATAALDSEHVVRVLEVGRTEGDVPYLTMERLQGNDLAHHLRQRRRLSPNKTSRLIRHVASGLETARQAGIVHRDIKPQNLFLAEDGDGGKVWKILDFGVAKQADSSGTLTKGHVVGTPGYMAPEQARGKEVDHSADLYALAAIAYRALTGRPPFSGKDVPTTLYNVVYEMPRQPSELVEIHADVDSVIAVGMAKKPEDRFATGAELAEALADALRGKLSAELRARAEELLQAAPWRKTL